MYECLEGGLVESRLHSVRFRSVYIRILIMYNTYVLQKTLYHDQLWDMSLGSILWGIAG